MFATRVAVTGDLTDADWESTFWSSMTNRERIYHLIAPSSFDSCSTSVAHSSHLKLSKQFLLLAPPDGTTRLVARWFATGDFTAWRKWLDPDAFRALPLLDWALLRKYVGFGEAQTDTDRNLHTRTQLNKFECIWQEWKKLLVDELFRVAAAKKLWWNYAHDKLQIDSIIFWGKLNLLILIASNYAVSEFT